MKHLLSVFIAVAILFSSTSSFAKEETILATFQDSMLKEIVYEVVKKDDTTLFRTKIEPFIKLNGNRLSGKRAALDTIQSKLIEFVTEKKNFSVEGQFHVIVDANYVSIELERSTINGVRINIIDLITSDTQCLVF